MNVAHNILINLDKGTCRGVKQDDLLSAGSNGSQPAHKMQAASILSCWSFACKQSLSLKLRTHIERALTHIYVPEFDDFVAVL